MIFSYSRFFREGKYQFSKLLKIHQIALLQKSRMDSDSLPSGKREVPDNEGEDVTSKKPKLINDNILKEKDAPEPFVRVKTKKMAILLCYCGKNYFGLQRNMDVPTVEEDVLKALLLTGLITKEHYEVPQLLAFQRAARTDKGVSALKQVLSMKLPVETSQETAKTINSHLPPQIRVIAIKKATRGFNSKNNCDGRTYTYMTPSFAFAPLEALVTEDFRISKSQLEELNTFLALYKGSHNFHNFTSGRKSNDPSSNRYILQFECGEPFVSEGLEFVRLRVRGQSFMMHQIRKMVALAIAKMRGLANEETLKKAWSKDKVDLPKAPGVGLLLEDVHYDGYNKRYGGDGIHESLLWDDHTNEIMEFMESHISPTIVETEKKEKSMLTWLATLTLNSYDTFDPEKNHRNHPEHFRRVSNGEVLSQNQDVQEAQDLTVCSSGGTKEAKGEPEEVKQSEVP